MEPVRRLESYLEEIKSQLGDLNSRSLKIIFYPWSASDERARQEKKAKYNKAKYTTTTGHLKDPW